MSWLIDPVARTISPIDFAERCDRVPDRSVRELAKTLKAPADIERVHVHHYLAAAEALGHPSPLAVAPYLVSGTMSGDERTVLWAFDGIPSDDASRAAEPGFRIFGGSSKWLRPAIVVRYRKRRPQAAALSREELAGAIEWVAPGTAFHVDDWPLAFCSAACKVCGARTGAGGSKLLMCGRCRQVCYCGKECQRSHWPAHKQAGCSDEGVRVVIVQPEAEEEANVPM